MKDIEEAMGKNGSSLKPGDIVLIHYGWMKHWTTSGNWKYYAMNQPGLTSEVADWIIENQVKSVGTDTIAVGTSVKDGQKIGRCHFHERVLRKHIYLIECLINLDKLPARSFFMAAPLKIRQGSGSPIRAMAFV
jgi:kynurenine formamidase